MHAGLCNGSTGIDTDIALVRPYRTTFITLCNARNLEPHPQGRDRANRSPKLLFRASVTWLTHPLPVKSDHSQEADMALQPHRLEFKSHRLEFIFGMVLAMAVTILTITTWAAPPNPESDSAAPIPPIYRPYHLNLY